jgi:hypothetical protein
MDRRIALLREFYGGLPRDRAKVETRRHGFRYLEELLSDGVTLEYGELTLSGLLHKYKLANIPEHRMAGLFRSHVEKECNLCLYFDGRANNLFCFNLDNNHKTNNTAIIPEMELAVGMLREHLERLGCAPLVVASGRGFHLWCRLEGPVDNDRLYEFMLRSAAKTAAALHKRGLDHNRIKVNLYPDRRIRDVVSLRLFGSEHAKNRVFSRVLDREGLLDEEASWSRFERYLEGGAITLALFDRAHGEMMASF